MMVRKTIVIASAAFALFGIAAMVCHAGEQTKFSANVSEWSSTTVSSPTVLPIGGSGQVNGNFVVSARNGAEIGIRASRRFLQSVDPLVNFKEKQVGVYLADTGVSDGLGRATWNYDIHLDLRNAFGVAKGKTLDDYTLVLNTDIGNPIFGFPVPINIGDDFALPGGVVLFQTSLNPKFGNAIFDANVEGVYSFTLTLTPKTFKGPPIVANMSVIVAD